MSMLDNQTKTMLVENMRKSLAKSVLENKELNESDQTNGINFIAESATYEQLLNMTMNPLRESKYLPSHVLEAAVAICSSAMMTGRKVIGVNAITEGALKLQKKTGAVITESMLDAALELAKSNGLNVVATCLKEAFQMKKAADQKALEEAAKPQLSARGKALQESVQKGEIVTEMSKKDLMTRVHDQLAAEGEHNPTKKQVTDAIRKYEGSGSTPKGKSHTNKNNLKRWAGERKATAKAQAKKAANQAAHANVKKGADAAYQAGQRMGNQIGFEAGHKAGMKKVAEKTSKALASQKDRLTKKGAEAAKKAGKSGLKKGLAIGAGTVAAAHIAGRAIKGWQAKKAAKK